MAPSAVLKFGYAVEAASGVFYKILQKWGAGGNSDTFLVVATTGTWRGTPFAMKVFRRLSKPERKEEFSREIRFLKNCSHPSIMRVFDNGEILGEHPFVIAEFLPQTLYEVIRDNRASTAVKISYALQLLSALDYLSMQSPPVVHRDIKPQNIFIKGHSCVLGDFGLIKMLEPNAGGSNDDIAMIKESLGAGMPKRYRTPDLVSYLQDGSIPTCKSDVYQLGLVLCELFTEKNPQKKSKKFTDPVKLSRLKPVPGLLGEEISNSLKNMLVQNPQERESPDTLIEVWQGFLFDAAKRFHDLEGRVFLSSQGQFDA